MPAPPQTVQAAQVGRARAHPGHAVRASPSGGWRVVLKRTQRFCGLPAFLAGRSLGFPQFLPRAK